jgi:hypothetical protein
LQEECAFAEAHVRQIIGDRSDREAKISIELPALAEIPGGQKGP